jgi:hypothetical protein
LTILLAMQTVPGSSQEIRLEQEVKAAFLYNFAKFVEWPATAFAGENAPFTFCLLGAAFREALETTIQGETVEGRRLAVRQISGAENVRSCQILFIGQTEAEKTKQVLSAVSGVPVLTVGEITSFIANGGMVRFIRSGNRLRFEINPDAAARASLKVSSRLLRVADVIRPGGGR